MTHPAAARVALAVAACSPAAAWAHSFDERYDLPLPLAYFVGGAAATIALTFVVAVLLVRRAPQPLERDDARAAAPDRMLQLPLPPALRAAVQVCRAVSLALFILAVSAAFLGSGDPLMNLAPTLIWIVWWVGLTLLVACCGNFWPLLDPWRTLSDIAGALARRAGPGPRFPYPQTLGAWPALGLLLLWSWFELVFPLASAPQRVAWAALAWTAVTLGGMACFGRPAWQRNADVFALYFSILGRFAPLAVRADGRGLLLRAPGAGLLHAANGSAPDNSLAHAGFVIAMLSTVLFDGLRGGAAWAPVEAAFGKALPGLTDVNGYVAGTLGLLGLWLVFFAAYWLACLVASRLLGAAGRGATGLIARRFAWTLVPIAIGYNLAHNFSGLLIQGQNIIPLLSDPFARGWDLFGTAQRYPDIGLVDARTTWYVAVAGIVGGHVIAVWLAHRVALRQFGAPRRAAVASAPLTVLMVAYTAVSLSVIAEPMVKFAPEPPRSARSHGAGQGGAIAWKAPSGALPQPLTLPVLLPGG